MITREEALRLMQCKYIYSEMERKFSLINAFGRKLEHSSPNNILSWDQVINWMNGGVKNRGEEFNFDIGPSRQVVDRNFDISMRMHLGVNDESSNDRICTTIEISDDKTQWKSSKNFYWCDAENLAVLYYALQIMIHELSEAALEKGKHEIKMTPKLHKEIFEALKLANLE